jgi:hypothetical protein
MPRPGRRAAPARPPAAGALLITSGTVTLGDDTFSSDKAVAGAAGTAGDPDQNQPG